MARKAARASSGASPRSSTPRPFFESLTEIEKSLRKQKKLLREIDALSSKAPATLNQGREVYRLWNNSGMSRACSMA